MLKRVVDLHLYKWIDSIDSDCPSGKGVVENQKWYTTGETESHISIHVGLALLHSYEMCECGEMDSWLTPPVVEFVGEI